MAFTAAASQGFQSLRYVEKNEILWVPGDPGDTFNKGDVVTFTTGEGLADIAAADEAPFGVVAETVVCPAATAVGFPTLGEGASVGWGQLQDASTKTLVPIIPLVPVGTPIFDVSISDQNDDENVVSYSSLTLTVGSAAQDDANGALVYVYGGAGKGQWNIVQDVGSSNDLVLHRIFDTALDATSDVIWLAGEAADSRGVGFFGRVTLKTAASVDVSDGADNGGFVVYLDARSVVSYLRRLMLPVIPAGAFLMA